MEESLISPSETNLTVQNNNELVLNDAEIFKTKNAKNLIKGFSLSITYAATIAGTGSLIGTSSNIVFKGYFESKHPGDSLNFLTFMLYSLPISIVLVIMAWVVLCLMWLPKG